MAAAYLHHLVMNHPFVDENKRVDLERAKRCWMNMDYTVRTLVGFQTRRQRFSRVLQACLTSMVICGNGPMNGIVRGCTA